jgi:hypothetical protein
VRLGHISKANVESLRFVSGARTQDSGCESREQREGQVTGHQSEQADPAQNDPNISGGDIEEATPDPIPNSEVKLFGADGTAREAVWESRTLPGLFRTGSDAFASGPFRFCSMSWAAGLEAATLGSACAVGFSGWSALLPQRLLRP